MSHEKREACFEMNEETVHLTFVAVTLLYKSVTGSTTPHRYERDINPELQAHNLSLPFFKTFTVKIMFNGFTITVTDACEQFIMIELHGNINSYCTDYEQMKYHGLLDMVTQEKCVSWHYNNFDAVLKEGDYFFFILCGMDSSGRFLKFQPGHFHSQMQILTLLFVSSKIVDCLLSNDNSAKIETTTHYYYEREIDPNLEAYNLSIPEFTNFSVAIYKKGFKLIIKDELEKYVLLDLHGSLNNRNDDISEAEFYDVLQLDEINDTIYWYYRNHKVNLKDGDYFYYFLHATDKELKVQRLPPGHFQVRKKYPAAHYNCTTSVFQAEAIPNTQCGMQ